MVPKATERLVVFVDYERHDCTSTEEVRAIVDTNSGARHVSVYRIDCRHAPVFRRGETGGIVIENEVRDVWTKLWSYQWH